LNKHLARCEAIVAQVSEVLRNRLTGNDCCQLLRDRRSLLETGTAVAVEIGVALAERRQTYWYQSSLKS
jgi:hypothetical protein